MNIGSENETTEFKTGLAQLDKGLIALTAMLNRHGRGTVYFGVADDGTIVGIESGKDTMERIRRRISDYIEPKIIADIAELKTDDGKTYISVSAINHSGVFSFDGRYYIRNVSSNERVPVDVLFRIYQSRGFDAMREQPSPIQDLSFSRINVIMTEYAVHWRNDDSFYQSHGMLTSDRLFNLVAYLMSDQNNYVVQMIRYNGRDKTEMSDRTDLGHRCLIDSLRDMISKVGLLMETKVDTTVRPRKQIPLFDMESFTESWINACVHNNWLMDTAPSVFIFDDRLEIQSYGSIPVDMTLEQFFTGHSHPVNKTLFDLMALLDLTEQSGHGVPTVVDAYGRDAFEIYSDMIVVRIPFAFEPGFATSRKSTERNSSDLTERQRWVLEELLKDDSCKLSDIAERTGIGISTVKKEVAVLKEKNLIRNDGTTRNARWVVP